MYRLEHCSWKPSSIAVWAKSSTSHCESGLKDSESLNKARRKRGKESPTSWRAKSVEWASHSDAPSLWIGGTISSAAARQHLSRSGPSFESFRISQFSLVEGIHKNSMKRWMSILGHPPALVQQQFEPCIFSETQTSIFFLFAGNGARTQKYKKVNAGMQHDSTWFNHIQIWESFKVKQEWQMRLCLALQLMQCQCDECDEAESGWGTPRPPCGSASTPLAAVIPET